MNKCFKKCVKKCIKKFAVMVCLGLFLIPLFVGTASATTGSSGLPWETSIKILADSMSGPVAFALGILMIIAGAFGIMFGGDLQGWIRWACLAAIVAGMIGTAPGVLQVLGLTSCVVV